MGEDEDDVCCYRYCCYYQHGVRFCRKPRVESSKMKSMFYSVVTSTINAHAAVLLKAHAAHALSYVVRRASAPCLCRGSQFRVQGWQCKGGERGKRSERRNILREEGRQAGRHAARDKEEQRRRRRNAE